jgi:hypothetical protein
MRLTTPASALVLAAAAALPTGASAQSSESIARQLANPLSPIARIPLTFDWDRNIGTRREGERLTFGLSPTVPIDLNRDFDLISRTDAALIAQSDVAPGAGNQFGFGDVLQTLYLAPKLEFPGGLRWGAGPALLLPVGTDSRLSGRRWAVGPAGVLVVQSDAWTYGLQGSHIWSISGEVGRPHISLTSAQPFISYTTRDAWTFGLASEATFDWERKRGTLPVSVSANRLIRAGDRPITVGGAVRYYLDSPDTGPHGWAFRLGVTLAFP